MMGDTMVGIREIRRNLSVYVARVKGGEGFIVTERGKPVARLGPYSEPDDPLAKIRARGLIVREANGLPLANVVPLDVPWDGSLSDIISEMREDRF